jgi:hyperosmotically inducible protein
MKMLNAGVLTLVLACGVGIGAAQDANNTRANKQPDNKTETADQAKNNKNDVRLMRDIRRTLMKDNSLSTNAHNVKVIASGGKVTLKGPVNSEDEKKSVEQKATEVAGSGNVTSELTVAANQ